jgi:alkanesulfonate monooxygenase
LTDSPALPKPVQRPYPPIIVGGAGRKRIPRLAASFGDEFNIPFNSLAETEAQFSRVRAACQSAGRDPATIVLSAAQIVCCGADETEVARRAKAIGRDAGELRANGVAGTPDEVVERLRAFGAVGAERVYLQVLDFDDLDHVRLLSQRVLPHLA